MDDVALTATDIAEYSHYITTCLTAGLKAPALAFKSWSNKGRPTDFSETHRIYEGTCPECASVFAAFISHNSKSIPKFCSDKHRAIFNLSKEDESNKEAKEILASILSGEFTPKAQITNVISVTPVAEVNEKATAPTPNAVALRANNSELKAAIQKKRLIQTSKNDYVSSYQRQQEEMKNKREERRKQKNAKMLDFRCPTPFKQMFLTVEDAQRFIDVVHPDDEMLETYSCRCGSVHFGHKRQAQKKVVERNHALDNPDRTWCAYPNLAAYATVEDVEAYLDERLAEEKANGQASAKKCSCGNYHVKFSYMARKKNRQERSKGYTQESEKRLFQLTSR